MVDGKLVLNRCMFSLHIQSKKFHRMFLKFNFKCILPVMDGKQALNIYMFLYTYINMRYLYLIH